MSPDYIKNGWSEWGRHVLAELERLDRCLDEANAHIDKLVTEIAVLKVKAGIWGLIGGALPAIGAIAVALVLLYLDKGI